MRIGILKERKAQEARVALPPDKVYQLLLDGHEVWVEKGAGVLSSFPDADYKAAGAKIVSSFQKIIQSSDLLLKVKEPTLPEARLMRKGQMIFCYLHLAGIPQIMRILQKREVIALGYETVQLPDGRLPLLKPMSEIAGRLAIQNGAEFLRADKGGRGVLIGGTDKVQPAKVLILGGGVVGENAIRVALGMGALTTVMDVSPSRLAVLQKKYPALSTVLMDCKKLSQLIRDTDLCVGAVLIPGAKAPKLVTRAMVKTMKRGSVIVDVSVDQGGCVETAVVTSHAKPVVVRYGVLHYGVPNMPGAVPLTSTQALSQETFPYIRALAALGLEKTIIKFPEMKLAVNLSFGTICHPALIHQ